MIDLLDTLGGVVVGAVLGGVASYVVGRRQGREQARYDRQAEAVTELRRRLRETREVFAELATPSKYRLGEDRSGEELAKLAGEKLDALDGYLQDHALWLDRGSHERLDALTDQLAFGLAEVQQRLKDEVDEDEAVRTLWVWLRHGVADEIDELNEEVDRSLGIRPWWRRMFGG